MIIDYGIPKDMSLEDLAKIAKQAELFYQSLIKKKLGSFGSFVRVSPRNALIDILRATEKYRKGFYPEFGEFSLIYDPNQKRLVLSVLENNPAKPRLEYALSYAISEVEALEAKVGRDNL